MGLKDNLRELEALRDFLVASEQGAEFGREVRQARTHRGLTLDALASATGMAKSYLSQIETSYTPPPRDEKVRKIATALGLDPEALVAHAHFSTLPDSVKERLARLRKVFNSTEEVIRALLAARERAAGGTLGLAREPAGTPEQEGAPAPAGDSHDLTGAAGESDGRAGESLDLDELHRSGLLHHLAEWGAVPDEERGRNLRPIPVINKVAAGYPQDFTDLGYPVGIADEYVSVPEGMSDPNAFAVHVDGDSMEPKYHKGDIVIFSPAAEVASGNDCFVRFGMTGGASDGLVTFKRVFFDAEDRIRLQPINDKYAPTFARPSEIAGIFRAVARYEKL
jgi:SOS-response transcriptional repressor LexA/transcriptional regulator with XRE-family HTH domain